MKDFNFFEPYLQVSKKKARSKVKNKPIAIILKVIALILFLGAPIFIFGNIYLDQKAITEMETELASVEMQDALKRVDEKRKTVVALEALFKDLGEVDRQLAQMDVVTNDQMVAMAGAIPENVVVENLSLAGDSCEITGKAFKLTSIPEFELNLRNSELFYDLLIGNITKVDDVFEYTISFSLFKEVQ